MTETTSARLQDMLIGAALCLEDNAYLLFRHEHAARWLRRCCAEGLHEPVMSQLLIDFVRRQPSAVFLDIGALFGYFGLLALAASQGRASAYAFEMNPDSFEVLRESIRDNTQLPRNRILPTHGAVGDIDLPAQLTTYKGFTFNSPDRDAGMAAIRSLTIDSFCDTHQIVPSLIKIDVEGYEEKVLRGARKTLQNSKTVTMMELHHNSILGPLGTSRSEIAHQLLDDGLRLYYFGKHRADIVDGRLSAVILSRSYLDQYRGKFDFFGDDLIVVSRDDIREHWPDLNVMTSGDIFPKGMLTRGH